MQSQYHDRDGLCPIHKLAKSIGDKPMSEMTLRDHLIAQAFQGLMSNPDVTTMEPTFDHEGDEVMMIDTDAPWGAVHYAELTLELMARIAIDRASHSN